MFLRIKKNTSKAISFVLTSLGFDITSCAQVTMLGDSTIRLNYAQTMRLTQSTKGNRLKTTQTLRYRLR